MKTEVNNDDSEYDTKSPEDDGDINEESPMTNQNGQDLMTNFLFGNIDARGQLKGDIFDPATKQHLASLSRLGLESSLREVIGNDDKEIKDDQRDEAVVYSPSAVDYFDINEFAEEEHFTCGEKEDTRSQCGQLIEEDVKPRISPVDDDEKKRDFELMPAPLQPTERSSQRKQITTSKPITPLSAMLPVKFSDVDVMEFFPNFRQDSVLRFSRLFKPKQSHLSKTWKHCKKRRKKLTHERSKDNHLNNSEEKPLFGNEELRNNKQGLNFSEESSFGFEMNFGPDPNPSDCVSDDEIKFCNPVDLNNNEGILEGDGKTGRETNDPKEADWRFGPAQLWYDMLEVSPTGEGFDYGFQIAPKEEDSEDMKYDAITDTKPSLSRLKSIGFEDDDDDVDDEKEFPDDAFHLITQRSWEDDIIWNGDDIKHKVKLNQKLKNMAAGWIPSNYKRTTQTLTQPSKSTASLTVSKKDKKTQSSKGGSISSTNITFNGSKANDVGDKWYSIFSIENDELVYDRWEDDIIWDPDNMEKIPEPKVLTLDPNDENIILFIPEDVDPSTLTEENEEAPPVKVKIHHPHVKKSKILLGKAGMITTIEEEAPPSPSESQDKDPFNLSNDEYYQARSTIQTINMGLRGGCLQHSTPVVELQSPFVPTYMGEKSLRSFHRPTLKHYSHGKIAKPGPHPVHPLINEIKRKAKQREEERSASGGGDIFLMRTPNDLTGKDGDIILVEYCEEFPPHLSQVGMCTRIKNYYKRRIANDEGPPVYRFGETAYAHSSPFLGLMHHGQSIQTLENNMYRSPIYEHKIPKTDFLVIRTRNGYSVRVLDALFCSGQQCPLYEVPGPNSKKANNFIKDFLQVFIYRLFCKSKDTPRRIKMDEIRLAFPTHSESSIRKRLKPCAEFKRTGINSNWWVIKPEFRLPTEDEIRALISPEQCSSYFSMLAAQQRLKDAGYGDKFISALEDENDDDTPKEEDEVMAAPWHTTRAYIQAVKGKGLLQLTGSADPTGCGEGFSYVRIPIKPTWNKESHDQQPKKNVTGTDADLRKLGLKFAKDLLRDYGLPEEEIKKLTRWEVIDVVRTLSTEKAKAGEETMSKFSRGSRFSMAEYHERYKEECQRLFELQNKILASEEVLSTDEWSSEEEENDSDMEEKGKYLENILANKKTSSQMTLENEEQERKELQKMIMGEDHKDDKKKNSKKEDESGYGCGTAGRLLRITRTYYNADGKKYTRVETVRKTAVIDYYVKIRTTKDDNFIQTFAESAAEKEERKRQRRRQQEQLRRIKRQTEKLQNGNATTSIRKSKLNPDLKMKCGACGQVGHMRTNKSCPRYSCTPGPISDDDVGPVRPHTTIEEPDELVNVDGTKLKFSSKVIKQAEDLKRRSCMTTTPKDGCPKNSQRRRTGTVAHCDYLKRKNKSVNRRLIDPVITLSTIFEEILNEMRAMADVQPFLYPVNIKQVPDYYNVIQHPMDLSTIRDNLRQKKYQSREEFLSDITQIVENSKRYNGENSTLTEASRRMLHLCIDRIAEKEERLMRLEKAINPLLEDDDQVAFTYILDSIVNAKLFTMQESWPFMKPVNKKNVKDYYEIIQQPMDLQTVAQKVKNHKYHNRRDFMYDIELILTNSEKYNGPDSAFTQKAKTLVLFCNDRLTEFKAPLEALEQKISLTQERALEQADGDLLESLVGLDEEESYTFPKPNSLHNVGSMGALGSPIEDNMEFYGNNEEHVNVNAVDLDFSGSERKFPTVNGRKNGYPPEKRVRYDTHQLNLLEDDLDFSDDEDDDRERMGHQLVTKEAEMRLMHPGVRFDETDGQNINNHLDRSPYANVDQYHAEETYVDGTLMEMRGVDENYDPSMAFTGEMIGRNLYATINNDLAVSDSDDEEGSNNLNQDPPQDPSVYDDGMWF